MPWYLKFIVHLLLVIVAIQVLNLDTTGCTATARDGRVTVHHTISSVVGRCFQQATDHHSHKTRPGDHNNHHHKSWKKFFSEKIAVTFNQRLTLPPHYDASIDHRAVIKAYEFLYFKSINPPPPKA